MSGFNAKDFEKYTNYIVSEVEEGIIHIQLNNPRRLNAFSEKYWRDYHELLVHIDSIPSTNVILISSAVAKAFSTGLDLKSVSEELKHHAGLSPEERQKALKKHIDDFQYCVGTPARITTPTIALLNGLNFGLALDLGACYSVRVATQDATFSITEIKVGLSADIGSLQRLPALFNNKSQLYRYALTGENFGAEDALKYGYVSKVVPDIKSGVEYIKELAADINQYKQWAIKGTKKHIQDILDGRTVEEGLKDISDYNSKHLGDTLQAPKKSAKL